MPYGRHVHRGGDYNRLAEPDWTDPLDISFSRDYGGRWNEPGSYGVLYLNATERMARLQVAHKLAGQPFAVEDLDPSEQHDLVYVQVEPHDFLDCVSDSGLSAVGLPASYPRHADDTLVEHPKCWPVGAAARQDGFAGVACRSAATGASGSDEELAVFDTAVDQVTQTGRQSFAEWYLASDAP